jgi:hypothetical protein
MFVAANGCRLTFWHSTSRSIPIWKRGTSWRATKRMPPIQIGWHPCDKGWIVITCDHGKDKKKERLPLICKAWKITHIALSPTLLRKGPTHQKNAIVSVWEEIFDLDKYPAGTQVVLGENGTARSGATRFALRPKLEAGRD